MLQHEKTVMAFDELGREYIIDMYVSARDLGELPHAGATGEEPASFRTRDGHTVTHLGGGEFAVRVPGSDDVVIVRTDDSEFV